MEDTQRLSDNVSNMKGHLGDLGRDISDTAHSGMAAAKEKVTQTYDSARKQGQDALDSTAKHVSDHPLMSLGLAAVAGLVVGLLIFRPRS